MTRQTIHAWFRVSGLLSSSQYGIFLLFLDCGNCSRFCWEDYFGLTTSQWLGSICKNSQRFRNSISATFLDI